MTSLGLLVMAYGGPDSLDDVGPYLLDIRGGRPTPPALVAEIRDRYRCIGGSSPLRAITEAQAAALGRELRGAAWRSRWRWACATGTLGSPLPSGCWRGRE